MGIDKRSLMEDYYIDEIDEVIAQWNALRRADVDEEEVDAMTFFGNGGETIGEVSGFPGEFPNLKQDWSYFDFLPHGEKPAT